MLHTIYLIASVMFGDNNAYTNFQQAATLEECQSAEKADTSQLVGTKVTIEGTEVTVLDIETKCVVLQQSYHA